MLYLEHNGNSYNISISIHCIYLCAILYPHNILKLFLTSAMYFQSPHLLNIPQDFFYLWVQFCTQASCWSYTYCNAYPCFLLSRVIGWAISSIIFHRHVALDTKLESDIKDSNFLGIHGINKPMLAEALILKEHTIFIEIVSHLIPFACMASTSACLLLNTL